MHEELRQAYLSKRYVCGEFKVSPTRKLSPSSFLPGSCNLIVVGNLLEAGRHIPVRIVRYSPLYATINAPLSSGV